MGEKLDTGEILLYLRDETGAVVGLKYRTDSDAEGVYQCYFFEKNLQGDVVVIKEWFLPLGRECPRTPTEK